MDFFTAAACRANGVQLRAYVSTRRLTKAMSEGTALILLCYWDCKNSTIASCSLRDSRWNCRVTRLASPRCRRVASRSVTDAPSCINRVRSRTPHNGAVRTLFAVLRYSFREKLFQVTLSAFGPEGAAIAITVPSLVPTSWSGKSDKVLRVFGATGSGSVDRAPR